MCRCTHAVYVCVWGGQKGPDTQLLLSPLSPLGSSHGRGVGEALLSEGAGSQAFRTVTAAAAADAATEI